MSKSKHKPNFSCQVCGGKVELSQDLMSCRFCGFKKILAGGDTLNQHLLSADDVNEYFKSTYNSLTRNETFELNVPVDRFYLIADHLDGQINFFKSKNIMFLLEQHGFQMVSRKSRFSGKLSLVVRKV